MLRWHQAVPEYLMAKINSAGIYKEVYNNFGICRHCIDRGEYPKKCVCCEKERFFPSEFEYEVTQYAKYPEDETETYFICKFCVNDRPKDVMSLLAEYDDSSTIRKGRK